MSLPWSMMPEPRHTPEDSPSQSILHNYETDLEDTNLRQAGEMKVEVTKLLQYKEEALRLRGEVARLSSLEGLDNEVARLKHEMTRLVEQHTIQQDTWLREKANILEV